MNARMSSRPFLYTPGRIIVPSAANSSANAVASWAAHARTSRAGIAAISARSASDGPVPAQYQSLDGGYGHALAVHRIEYARGVSDDQQPGGEPAEPLIAPPDAGREPEGVRLAERLGVLDGLINLRDRQRPDVVQEAAVVRGRAVTENAGERDRIPIRQPGEDSAAPHGRRRYRDQRDVGADRIERQRWAEVAGGVRQVHADSFFRHLRIPEFGQPARCPRAAAGRVDDKVRLQHLFLGARVRALHAHASYLGAIRGRC